MKKLLERVVKTTTFQFNGRFHREVDGVAMGSPIAPLMADVCMNYIIDQALAVTPPECRPDLLCRYVDDLFLLQYFLTKILSTGSLPILILFTGILSLPRS